jgi:hypothetical protein
MMITKSIIKSIRESGWLKEDAVYQYGFTKTTPVHKVYETILMNVSINFGINWKIILKAKRVSDPAYKAKIISLVLIDKALNNIKNMDRSDVDVIIGRENAILVNDFYLSY